MYFIGIDPDSKKSGYAVWDSEKRELIEFGVLAFFELFATINTYKLGMHAKRYDVLVIIEAGWLNKKSNWHNNKQGVHVASRIGKNVGANHQTGALIVNMCKHLGVKYELVKPEKSKIQAKMFAQITGIKRSNQDVRDAVILVFNR